MSKEVIIISTSSASKEGIMLHTNTPARLKGKNGTSAFQSTWVSWDKIGQALFENYTEKESVEDRQNMRLAAERKEGV